MADSTPGHPDISRYLQFLCNESPLTDDEHDHFLNCQDCVNAAAETLLKNAKKQDSPET
jgi:hypothetical protein